MHDVLVPGAVWFDTEAGGAALRLFVWRPATPPPAEGYPVIYVLDGNAHFLSFVASVKALTTRPELTGLDPAVIVAIGYPTDADYDYERRMLDYTPDVPRASLGLLPGRSEWPPTGGADAMIERIETAIKPLIEAEMPIDRTRQSLFGHSFGGLFTLYVALTRPQLYTAYLASSPSVWLGDGHVLSLVDDAAERLKAIGGGRRMMVSVGALEAERPPGEAAQTAEMGAWVRRNNMLGNIALLKDRLAGIAPELLACHFLEIEGEHHGSVPPVAINRAIPIALKS